MNKQDNTSLVPVSAQEQMTKPAVKTWRPVIFIGFLVLLGFFGGFGGWAAVAPLGSGAIAVGQVQVASQQKMLQSKDGGVITALHVRNGDIVKSGQILVDLDATQLQVQVNLLTGQLWNFLGREARLRAERQKADSIQFSDILLEARGRPEVAEIIQGETRLFESRRAALRSQLSLLERRVAKTREEITAHRAEQKADGRQLVLIEEEITAKRELVEKGWSGDHGCWLCSASKRRLKAASAIGWLWLPVPSSQLPKSLFNAMAYWMSGRRKLKLRWPTPAIKSAK